MKLSIESFAMKYIDEVLEVWNKALVHDQISRERFINEIILDPNFSQELFQIALNDHKVVGFIYGIVRKVPYLTRGLEVGRGWINIMAVDPIYQRQGIGSALMKSVEDALKHVGVSRITLCAYSPNYFTPGIDVRYNSALTLFSKNEYNTDVHSVSMKRDLFDYQLSESVKAQIEQLRNDDITFKPYTEADAVDLLDFVEKHFGGGWTSNVSTRMLKKEGEQTIIIAYQKDEIIGFCMRKMDGMDARFGPVGVNPDIRGKGIGGILLELMLENMKQHKIYCTYFLWTSGRNIDFYTKYGFTIYREYRMGEKNESEI